MTSLGFSKWFSNKRFRLMRLGRRRSASSTPHAPAASRDAKFLEAFRRFDADGDGRISSQELRSFLAWAEEDVSSEDAQRAIADFDSDGDGLLDYDDFMRLMNAGGGGGGGGAVGGGEGEDEDLRQAFEMFEAEKGSGRITAEGLRRMLCRLGDARSHEECARMIRAYDIDGDGELDYGEFIRMMS